MRLLIVGGGPVGLAAAIQARLHGMEALVFDRQQAPIDKACGEGLMPGGVQALVELGIHLPSAQTFQGIRYFQEDLPNEPIAEGKFGEGEGLGIRRVLLHQALVDRAQSLGAELHWGTRVTGLNHARLQTESGEVQGDWVLGADGLHSPTRKWAGLEKSTKGSRRYGLRRHYATAPWSDFVEVYWSAGCEAYVTPTGPESVGVALLWNQAQHRPCSQDPLAPFPRLRERLAGAAHASISRGAGPFHRRVRRVHKDKLLLVGDAAGYVDALTGEGIALGFRQAKSAIEALAGNRPEIYARTHRALCRRPFFLTRQLTWVASRPGLRRRLIRSLAMDPVLFSRFLDFMEGHGGWTRLGILRCARLLGRLALP
jgi:flavin-dependent dehydrogenase